MTAVETAKIAIACEARENIETCLGIVSTLTSAQAKSTGVFDAIETNIKVMTEAICDVKKPVVKKKPGPKRKQPTKR